MLPAIGIMIGFYIITRCLSFLLRRGDRTEPVSVMIFSLITIVVSAIVMLILVVKS